MADDHAARRADTERAVEAVWRIEAARVVAAAARVAGDLELAEDAAQEALVAALEQWPESGVPAKPGAWLATAARNRAIDAARRRSLGERKHEALGRELETAFGPAGSSLDPGAGDQDGEDLLRLIFTACHPILPPESRIALTLRFLGGLTTDEIARAYLVSEPTVAQRIVRAKRTLTEAKVPIAMPAGPEIAVRLASVLEVLYLIFNEGYSATSGGDWARPGLCEEALRLGRILAELLPRESEVHGLVALMEIQASRLRARIGPRGDAVRLLEQNRARWDRLLIRRGLAALDRAERTAAEAGRALGSYALQAEIAACHARATTAEATDWGRIAALYDALAGVAPSPVVELNRAVAVAMAFGPAAGLEIADRLRDEPALRTYHLLPAVRADLLLKLGRSDEARAELERAASLTRNEAERRLLLDRATAARR